MLYDSAFLGGQIRVSLPSFPDQVAIYLFLFNLPHILASFFPFMSREILTHYRKRIALGNIFIFCTFIPLYYISPWTTFLLLSVWTVFHVVFQQTGLSRMYMMTRSSIFYDYWKWVIGIFSCYLYILIYPSKIYSYLAPYKSLFIYAGMLAIAILTILVMRESETHKGRLYAGMTGVLILTSGAAFHFGYYMLAILGPRIVHDVTAFSFYIVHGMNSSKNLESDSVFRKLQVPFDVTPYIILAISFSVGYALTHGMAGNLSVPITIYVSLLHYYLDAFAWKKGSLLRNDIAFSY